MNTVWLLREPESQYLKILLVYQGSELSASETNLETEKRSRGIRWDDDGGIKHQLCRSGIFNEHFHQRAPCPHRPHINTASLSSLGQFWACHQYNVIFLSPLGTLKKIPVSVMEASLGGDCNLNPVSCFDGRNKQMKGKGGPGRHPPASHRML